MLLNDKITLKDRLDGQMVGFMLKWSRINF